MDKALRYIKKAQVCCSASSINIYYQIWLTWILICYNIIRLHETPLATQDIGFGIDQKIRGHFQL